MNEQEKYHLMQYLQQSNNKINELEKQLIIEKYEREKAQKQNGGFWKSASMFCLGAVVNSWFD